MNKKFLKHYMETNPEGTAQTYIFLVDNQDIALNIVMSGYQALCLVQEDDGYYFSADSFIEEMRSIQFTGSCQSAYHYVTACTVKWMNDKLQTFFKDAGLDGKAGWQLFKEKEYLGKLDNQKEVEKLLEQYILRFEREPKEQPELSRKLNQSLQQSNDDLRNRNGLKSRSEQEQLEEEIRDVRDQNSKLQIQVNKSSVEAVDEAQKKQKEAEKKMEQVESKARDEKKRAELEIRKAKKEVKDRMESMKSIEYFWGMGYITVILFAIIQNGAFQNDFTDVFDWKPFRDSSAWRCNQRVSTCEFDPVICVCQYGNHATQNVSPKET